jgi:hypothetical protein
MSLMRVTLNPDEMDFCQKMAEWTMYLKPDNHRVVSKLDPLFLDEHRYSSEMALAKLLGARSNPFPHVGGDGHKNDLLRGPYSISLKCRTSPTTPLMYIQPPNDRHRFFQDDFGVVGRRLSHIRLSFLTISWLRDWNENWSMQTIGGTRYQSGSKMRRILTPEYMYDILELDMILDQLENETLPTPQSGGYLEYQWNRVGGRGGPMEQWYLLPELAYSTT